MGQVRQVGQVRQGQVRLNQLTLPGHQVGQVMQVGQHQLALLAKQVGQVGQRQLVVAVGGRNGALESLGTGA